MNRTPSASRRAGEGPRSSETPPDSTAAAVPAEDPFGVARIAHPCVRVYDDRDDLPMSTVLAIAFDRDGYLWIGTQDGAAYFNGRVWRTVPMPARMGSNYVNVILAARDGSRWFGTHGGGLARLENGAWRVFDASSGLPSNTVTCIREDAPAGRARTLWVGTSGGVAVYEGGRWAVIDAAMGLPSDSVWSLLGTRGVGRGAPPDAVMWAGTKAGIARLARSSDGRWRVLDAFPSGADGLPAHPVRSLLATGEGGRTLWAGTGGGGLARLDEGGWTVFDAETGGLPGDHVWHLLETRSRGASELWAGTRFGLAKLDLSGAPGPGRWTVFDTSSGLPNANILSLARGRAGDRAVWVGTDGGLVRLDEGRWAALDTAAGLAGPAVSSVVDRRDDDGSPVLVFGTEKGVAQLRRGRWSYARAATGELPDDMVWRMLETEGPEPFGRSLWVATSAGVASFEDGRWSALDPDSVGPAARLFRVVVNCVIASETDDGSRALWFGSASGGVLRVAQSDPASRPRATVIDTSSGLPNDTVWELHETRWGGRTTLWVGTRNGMATVVRSAGPGPERWEVADASEGLPHRTITALYEAVGADGERLLWAGTLAGLAYRSLEDPDSRWTAPPDAVTRALPSKIVSGILQDGAGRMYVATPKGPTRFDPRAEGDRAWLAAYTFTLEDGLPGLGCHQGSLVFDRAGRVWMGTSRGAAVLDPSREVVDRTPKPLHIERVLVGGSPRDLANGATLAHDENDLEFEVALLSYFRPGDSRFRTQLVGYEPEPTEWSSSWHRAYTNLPPRPYVFRAWGRDVAGNVSGPVEIAFRIRPAPWNTWWAHTLYAGAVAGAAYAGMRYRTHALERRGKELEALVEQRTVELSQSEQRALEANRSKSVFLANMSHELRTPLNAVLGFAQLLERSPRIGHEEHANLEIIRRAGEHLLGLINDVLSISKIEAGKVALEERPFDLRQLLEAVERIIRVRAEAKGLELAVSIAPGLPDAVTGDEGKLRQVLLNLLGNAVKFTDHGRVELRARWAEGRGAFAVEDTGQGIAEEERSALFEPFVQTESGRSAREGTGLGLAISRRIVNLMGGDIGVASTPGVGTVFRFESALPRAASASPARRASRVVGIAGGQNPPRVLVADDTEENRLLLVRLLASVGFVVREASDGREALELWGTWRPDLVLMDMRMPVMGGREATRRIRAEQARGACSASGEMRGEDASSEAQGPSDELLGVAGGSSADSRLAPRPMRSTHLVTRIIALTASAFEHERDEILASGADDVVAKPFREETLLDSIAQQLRLEYVYEEGPGAAGRDPARPADALTSERLDRLPAGLVNQLRQAVAAGDIDDAATASRAIGEVDPELGRALLAEVGAYRFDGLDELLGPGGPEG